MKIFTLIFFAIALIDTIAALHLPKVFSSSTRTLLLNSLCMSVSSNSDTGLFQQCFDSNPTGVRLFSPAFPLEILTPISADEINKILEVKKLTNTMNVDLHENNKVVSSLLPWKKFPDLGLVQLQGKGFPSKSKILNTYNKYRHEGEFIWAYTIENLEKDCLLLNHWEQKVIYLSEYNLEVGAKGYELNHFDQHNPKEVLEWSPYTLEMEICNGNWQPVKASDNIINGPILDFLPTKLPKALWELVFLLLVSPDKHSDAINAVMNTGLSPKKGLIAYLRLIEKIIERTEINENVPDYQQIIEQEIII